MSRIVLYGRNELGPEESCYCQFRGMEPVIATSGDRYVIRRFSPIETIGGGEIYDPNIFARIGVFFRQWPIEAHIEITLCRNIQSTSPVTNAFVNTHN
jgi:hypothetical protein